MSYAELCAVCLKLTHAAAAYPCDLVAELMRTRGGRCHCARSTALALFGPAQISIQHTAEHSEHSSKRLVVHRAYAVQCDTSQTGIALLLRKQLNKRAQWY